MFTVRAFAQKILKKSDRRYSWDITNIGAAPIYYMRGSRGRDIAVAGEAQGVPVNANAADGYDEEDAIAEVWVIAAANVNVILGETHIAQPWPEYRYGIGGSRRTSPGRR